MTTAALLLVVTCSAAPLYDMSGPECVTPTEPCQCSECATWSPFPNAIRYEVNRTDANGLERLVGAVHQRPAFVEDGVLYPAQPPGAFWCFQKDEPPPVEGQRYTYKFRACTGASAVTCTAWKARNDDLPIIYWGAPMWCFRNGVRVGC